MSSLILVVFLVRIPNVGKCGPEKTPYLGTFHAVSVKNSRKIGQLDGTRKL